MSSSQVTVASIVSPRAKVSPPSPGREVISMVEMPGALRCATLWPVQAAGIT